MGHPPHRSGCVSVRFFALMSRSSRSIFFGCCCLSCLCTSFARDSSNGGFVGILFICRVACIIFWFLLCKWWSRLVYVVRRVLVSSGVV
jgi:hypothetical protein